MARCNCAGSSCGCSIIAGPGAIVTGTGSANNPYTVSVAPASYDVSGTITTPFQVGAGTFQARNRTVLDMAPTMPGGYTILLPDGSVAAPYPPDGGVIELFIGGTSGQFTGFGASVINWFGTAMPAGADKRGWYTFTFLGNRYAGKFNGALLP